MRTKRLRIRLSGVEVQLRDAGSVLVPWRQIGPRPHYFTSKLVRETFPGVPSSIALSGMPRVRSLVRKLQVRAAARRLSDPNFKEFATCGICSPAFDAVIGGSYLLLVGLAALVNLWKFQSDLPALVEQSPIVLLSAIALGIITFALIGVGVAVFIVAAASRRHLPDSLGVRITHYGVTAIHADGTERFISWKELAAAKPVRESLFAHSVNRPVILACGSILLEAARIVDARRSGGGSKTTVAQKSAPPIRRGLIAICMFVSSVLGIAFGFAQYETSQSLSEAVRVGISPHAAAGLMFIGVAILNWVETRGTARAGYRKR